jgi:phosphatidylglycerol:prolipoprotein diacylglycerol transferase
MILARCYANFYWFFKDVFGISVPPLQLVQTFGFFVAMAFLSAAIFLYRDLKRKEGLGFFRTYTKETIVGEPAKPLDLLLNALLGFILGYKLVGLFTEPGAMNDAQHWLLTGKGSIIGGIAGALILGALRYYEKKKQELQSPKKEVQVLYAHDQIGDIVLWAAIGGIGGAKLFYLFESPGNFEDFLRDPFGSFFGGLAIWGGIIGGTALVLNFARKRHINMIQLSDTAAPTLLLALAVGRLGCEFSGDGDWGINNISTKPGWLSWLPDRLWIYDYAHNVNHEGAGIAQNCHEAYCNYLVPMVYPTPLYEIVMLMILFGILWGIRKKLVAPGAMFSLYFIVSGIERMIIEQIRVNTKLDILGMKLTQAEFLSLIFMVGGTIGLIAALSIHKRKQREISPTYYLGQ